MWYVAAFLVACASVYIVGLGFRVWGVRGGEKRCRRCGYDLSGSGGKVCPECGSDGRGRARPRYAVVLGGLVLVVVAVQLWAQPDRRDEGVWQRWVPSTYWCIVERLAPHNPYGPVTTRTAVLRNRADDLWWWQTRLALGGWISDEVLEAQVELPKRWREGEPLPVQWTAIELPYSQWTWLRLSVTSPEAPELAVYGSRPPPGSGSMIGLRSSSTWMIPAETLRRPVTLVITATADGTRIGRVKKVVEIPLSPAGVQVLEADRSAAGTEYVKKLTWIEVKGRYIDFSLPRGDTATRVAVGARLELLRGERILMSCEQPLQDLTSVRFCDLPDDLAEEGEGERVRPFGPDVRVRITGVEALALRHAWGEKYWAGTIEMPLDDWVKWQKERNAKVESEKSLPGLAEPRPTLPLGAGG